jgi:hypothetical protein
MGWWEDDAPGGEGGRPSVRFLLKPRWVGYIGDGDETPLNTAANGCSVAVAGVAAPRDAVVDQGCDSRSATEPPSGGTADVHTSRDADAGLPSFMLPPTANQLSADPDGEEVL